MGLIDGYTVTIAFKCDYISVWYAKQWNTVKKYCRYNKQIFQTIDSTETITHLLFYNYRLIKYTDFH